MNDGRVVTALDLQALFFACLEIHRFLLARNGGGGLYGAAEKQGRAVGNAAVNAAVMVGLGVDAAVCIDAERIVGFAAPQFGKAEAAAEFDPLDGGDAEQHMGKQAFHTVKIGLADPGRHAGHRGFQHAAHAVETVFGGQDRFLHLFCGFGVQNGKIRGAERGDIFCQIGKFPVPHPAAGGDVRPDADILPRES